MGLDAGKQCIVDIPCHTHTHTITITTAIATATVNTIRDTARVRAHECSAAVCHARHLLVLHMTPMPRDAWRMDTASPARCMCMCMRICMCMCVYMCVCRRMCMCRRMGP